MVVVPAFAEREDGKQPVVAARVGGFIAARTEQVCERIDGEGVMPEQHSAEAERPDKHRPSADKPQHRAKHRRRHYVIFVQPAQFREFRKIADVIHARVVVFVGENPADVRPEKAEQRGRVQIQFLVGIAVMVAMMGRPPQHALLRRRHGHEGDDELEDAASLKRPV